MVDFIFTLTKVGNEKFILYTRVCVCVFIRMFTKDKLKTSTPNPFPLWPQVWSSNVH